MARLLRYGRWLLVAAGVVGYALLAHYTNTHASASALGAVVALAPIMLAAFSFAWHANRRFSMLALLAVACIALAMSWSTLIQHFSRIYWIEHAGTQLALGLWFYRTLTNGKEAACTCFARMVHGTLTPELERYTRQITAAWVIFFVVMAASSTIIYIAAPLATWSAFANFFTAPLTASMFLAEYVVRRRLHPEMDHAHILDAAKAYWNSPAR